MLSQSVVHLDPEPALFDAMLEGWRAQMMSRCLKPSTIAPGVTLVRRFAQYTNEYPWQWTPSDLDEFSASLRSQCRSLSTVRNYQIRLGQFCDYITDPRYEWAVACTTRFGMSPMQICTEANTARHSDGYEGRPQRRPLTLDELQRFFDYADAQVDEIRATGRKGAVAAFRDAILFRTVYAWGLRRREAVMLDMSDLHSHAGAPAFGRFGALHVRWGKAKRGGTPRRRTVLSLWDWAVEALDQYVTDIRPAFGVNDHPALWLTERGGRISSRAVEERFAEYRDAIGLPDELTLHCLRHSYVTHLVEAGYPERFVTEQVGHSWGSTLAIYCSVSDDFKNQVLSRALAGAFPVGGTET